jgi:hypothetical protein
MYVTGEMKETHLDETKGSTILETSKGIKVTATIIAQKCGLHFSGSLFEEVQTAATVERTETSIGNTDHQYGVD